MIYHIYWGTAGNAGLYLDEIYNSLYQAGFEQKAFVSYYFPFDYGEKIFFKRTEMEHCRYKGFGRRIVQALELVAAFLRILRRSKKDKPKLVNYSYVSRGNHLVLFFLTVLKHLSGCRLAITCHDVIPIINNHKTFEKEITIKKKILKLADYYIIHSANSREELLNMFNVPTGRILMHLFPLMDLSKVDRGNSIANPVFDFLFIGHMRPEKGIPLLIEAWQKYYTLYPNDKLCIAGNPDYFKEYLEKRTELCDESNISLKLGFISDADYITIVKSARCVVFPYTGGTNSGVVSTVVSLGRDIITSDIGMFTTNPFVPKRNMFKSGSVESLVEKMIAYRNGYLASGSRERIAEYRASFNKEVERVYSAMFNY